MPAFILKRPVCRDRRLARNTPRVMGISPSSARISVAPFLTLRNLGLKLFQLRFG